MFFSKMRNVNPPPLLGSHQRVLYFGTSGMRSESALCLSLVERGPVCKEWCNEFIQTTTAGHHTGLFVLPAVGFFYQRNSGLS